MSTDLEASINGKRIQSAVSPSNDNKYLCFVCSSTGTGLVSRCYVSSASLKYRSNWSWRDVSFASILSGRDFDSLISSILGMYFPKLLQISGNGTPSADPESSPLQKAWLSFSLHDRFTEACSISFKLSSQIPKRPRLNSLSICRNP